MVEDEDEDYDDYDDYDEFDADGGFFTEHHFRF